MRAEIPERRRNETEITRLNFPRFCWKILWHALLPGDHAGDLLLQNCRVFGGRQAALLHRAPRVLEPAGAQQAADHLGTKRRHGGWRNWHGQVLRAVGPGTARTLDPGTAPEPWARTLVSKTSPRQWARGSAP